MGKSIKDTLNPFKHEKAKFKFSNPVGTAKRHKKNMQSTTKAFGHRGGTFKGYDNEYTPRAPSRGRSSYQTPAMYSRPDRANYARPSMAPPPGAPPATSGPPPGMGDMMSRFGQQRAQMGGMGAKPQPPMRTPGGGPMQARGAPPPGSMMGMQDRMKGMMGRRNPQPPMGMAPPQPQLAPQMNMQMAQASALRGM